MEEENKEQTAEELIKEAESIMEEEPASEESKAEESEEFEQEKEAQEEQEPEETKEAEERKTVKPKEKLKAEKPKKPFKQSLIDFYDTKYKQMMYVTIAIMIISMVLVGVKIAATGDFINKDISLKGGTTLTILTGKSIDIKLLESQLDEQFPGKGLSVRRLTRLGENIGLIIDGTDFNTGDVISSLEEKTGKIKQEDYTVNVMGSSLGASFFKETLKAIYVSFLFMGLVVFLYFGDSFKMKFAAAVLTITAGLMIFMGNQHIVKDIIAYILGVIVLAIYFRTSAPSFMMIINVFADLVVTLAVVNLIGMTISTAGIASFLMIIGYCVESNILLTTKLIKKKEGVIMDKLLGALKTGLLMTSTAIAAVTIALVFTQSAVIKEIMAILLIGLFADMVYTWIQNVALLRMYIDKKRAKHEQI